MKITDRAIWTLISSWRNIGDRHIADAGEDRESADWREGWAWRHAASMLEQSAGFCATCTGQGEEYSPAFEDEPAAWFKCSMCDGTGESRWARQCGCCGGIDRDFHPEDAEFCISCTISKKFEAERGAEPFVHVLETPLGRHLNG